MRLRLCQTDDIVFRVWDLKMMIFKGFEIESLRLQALNPKCAFGSAQADDIVFRVLDHGP